MCTDIVTPEQRSRMMSLVKGKNTRPEMVVRSLCHAMGLRYRLHCKDLPGKPDLVFPKHRLCIFVHGCFWHSHSGCKQASLPKSRQEFWLPKLAKNVERDIYAQRALGTLGWRVVVIWECHTKNREVLRTEIQKIFAPSA
ncbi:MULTISPECIES: very short patch repair endonuclease [Pseudomonas]|uniref:Very short patch repair endonuclease n=1 Tax=Pseudomonas brassicacearum TaxID=930166 RepID=A0A423GFM3_9PSED|nr:very short patch repair endonuclease [Pseudomonas brassicacearum]ROM86034.1 very short patch repair endonuclease [Pseudomonas brassicacearum]